ncbi:DUF417 family protein [Methylobacterium oryzae CBMB20]
MPTSTRSTSPTRASSTSPRAPGRRPTTPTRSPRGLGTVELLIGLLVLVGLASRRLGLAGAVLAFLTPVVTLSFLVTTPEAWVGALGDAQHGFPTCPAPGASSSRTSPSWPAPGSSSPTAHAPSSSGRPRTPGAPARLALAGSR